MKSEGVGPLSPSVALIEQPENCELVPHLHRQNQFQLFVEGSGTLGTTPLEPGLIHYAGAYTGYGPLRSGPGGIKYFTFRAIADEGFILASEARTKMIRGPKRHDHGRIETCWEAGPSTVATRPHRAFVLLPDRGLAVEHATVTSGSTLTLQSIEASLGYFVFVIAGEAELEGRRLSRWESAFVSADESARQIEAADGRVELAIFHMPTTAPEYSASAGRAQ